MKAERLEELLLAWEEDALLVGELAELKHLLATEPEARRRLVEAGISRRMAEARAEMWRALKRSKNQGGIEPHLNFPSLGWMQWRPLTAAAAGIVLGMLCTSMVMGYMTAPTSAKSIPLFRESFEDGAQRWSPSFPERPGMWGGAGGGIVEATEGVQPLEGRRMARLEPSIATTLSYLERIVDLQSLPVPERNEMRHVTVTASFHAGQRGLRDRYTLRVAAFAERPEHVREQWVGREWREIDGAMATSKRALSTTPETEGWQTLTALVEVPPEARSLVISLASGLFADPDHKTAHYLDGVQATLSSEPLPTKPKRANPKTK